MKKLFRMEVTQGEDIELNNTSCGEILLSPTGKGTFCGDEIKGTIFPVGMGVTYTPYPGKNDIKAQMLLLTENEERILVSMNAYLDIHPEDEACLMAGEAVSSDRYYYKGIVSFQTGSVEYHWLERKVCICEGIIDSWEKLLFDVYLV